MPLTALAAIALIACAVPALASAAATPEFEAKELPINSVKLDDLSIADIDDDGDEDMFSTHHRYRGNLLTTENGELLARLDRSKLSTTADIPGFDDQYKSPQIVPAGLYIWVDGEGNTHIVTHDLRKLSPLGLGLTRVTGSIRYRGRSFDIKKAVGSRLDVRTDKSTNPPSRILDFDSGPDSEVIVWARFMDLPFDVSVSPLFPRQRIFMGPRRTVPPSHDVSIDLGDRHGVAWADWNRDGAIDVFISNGGERGGISRLSELNGDELYFGNGDGTFHEDIESTNLAKGLCRGRYAAPVDFDSDGDLDLFVGCQSGHPLLYNQKNVPGRFGSSSDLMQRANVRGDLFRWLDLDRDGAPELIAVDHDKVRVYTRQAVTGEFVRSQSLSPSTLGKTLDAISIGDFDRDLDPDIFVSSRGGNALLENRGGGLRSMDPRAIGLPGQGTSSLSFVDFDNDGRLDVHAAPGGLFRMTPSGTYRRTDAVQVGGKAQWATSSWIDLEGDGDRDLVSLIKRSGIELRKRVYENRTDGGHWLQLSLRGPAANRQAIGARVVVTTSRGRQAGWVGQSEGSRYSSGHYTLYFGLGPVRKVRTIRIWWPNS
jgi:hypothetical protein